MTTTAPLRRFVECLDGRRVPLNASERSEIPGDYPYWGANGVVDTVGRFLFNEDLVLLGEDGAPFDEPTREVAFSVAGPVWINNHIHVLRPKPGTNHRFLTYALNAIDWMLFVTGSTRLKLTQDDMMRARVPDLPITQQRAIADYLDTETARIDALITKKRRMIELLNERKALVAEDILRGLRDGEDLVPIKYLVEESDRRHGEGPEPLMLSVSIHDGVVPRHEISDKESRADDHTNYKTCTPGDIAINRMRAFQGGVGVVRDPGVVSPDYTVLRPGPRVTAEFLHFVMRSDWFVGEMTRRLRGIGATDQGAVRTPRINFADLGLIEIPVPPRQLQSRLADQLEVAVARANRVLKALHQQLELLAEHRQALISSAVTGELEIPVAA